MCVWLDDGDWEMVNRCKRDYSEQLCGCSEWWECSLRVICNCVKVHVLGEWPLVVNGGKVHGHDSWHLQTKKEKKNFFFFLFTRHSFIYWSVVDYSNVFYQLFGLSFWRHPFTHWWASDAMLHFWKSVPIKKQTHLHLGWPIVSRFSAFFFIFKWTFL